MTDELHDDFKEDENIDELFATHRQNTSQGNLNISFGVSIVVLIFVTAL